MKMIFQDLVPRKYHLEWSNERNTILIHIHKDCITNWNAIPKDGRLIRHISDAHSLDADGLFGSFSGDLKSDSFGFDRAIVKEYVAGEYTTFAVSLPKIRFEISFMCEYCGGTGRRLESFARNDEKCLSCKGSGHSHISNFRAGFATTASLGILFSALSICEETSAKEKQHIELDVHYEHGQHGSSLSGYLGIEISQYFISGSEALQTVILPAAIQAMTRAHGKMWVLSDYDRYTLRASVRNGFLILDCPGDACEIHFSDHDSRIDRDRKFTCHNVDTPLQSLTLLAGLTSIVGNISKQLET